MKKITLNNLNKLVSNCNTDNFKYKYTIDDEEIEIEFKTALSLTEYSYVVDNTVSGCFTSEGFACEYKEVLFIKNLIEVASNLPLPMINSGNIDEHNKPIKIVDLKKVHELAVMLKLNNFFDMHPALSELVSTLRSLIDEKLQYQKQLVIHSNNTDELVDAVVSFLDTATKTIEDLGGSLKGLDVNNINEIIGKVSKDGIDPDLLKGILDMGSETAPNSEVIK